MKISAFTLDELNLFRSQCSFTESEAACFELKARDETDVAIAFALNVSASTVSVIKRRMRSKIDEVLRQNVRKAAYPQQYPSCGNCQQRVLHTMAEWARLPDFLSVKGQEYVYTDYRTEGTINYPRSKMGDGGYSNGNYSRGDGYSRDASRKKMVQKLETLMDDTMSEQERMAIEECINRIDK